MKNEKEFIFTESFPATGINFQQYYGNDFEFIYILLHPFFRGPRAFAWKKVLPLSEFKNIEELHAGLVADNFQIEGPEWDKNKSIMSSLYEENLDLECPEEGEVPKLIISSLNKALVTLKINEVYISNEWIDNPTLVSTLEDYELETHGVIQGKNKSFYLAPNWDDFYSIFCCNNKSLLKEIKNINTFELLKVDSEMDFRWGLPKSK